MISKLETPKLSVVQRSLQTLIMDTNVTVILEF